MKDVSEIALEAAMAALDEISKYTSGSKTLTFKEKDTGKTSGSDVVSEADKAAEERIKSVILSYRPQDSIIGEESGATYGSGCAWVIDPIDGTLNFSYGRNEWAVSIAVSDEEGALAGVVALTEPRRIYTAQRGKGAFLNGEPIKARDTVRIQDAIIDVGRGRGETRTLFPKVVSKLDSTVKDLRRSGCAAMAACQVASGELDGMYGPGLEVWDIAAGALIAQEAGCVVLKHREDVVLIATPGVIDSLEGAIDSVVPRWRI